MHITHCVCEHIHCTYIYIYIYIYIIVHVCERACNIVCACLHAQSVGVRVQCICGHVYSVCWHIIQSTCRMSCTCYMYLCIIERMKFQNIVV